MSLLALRITNVWVPMGLASASLVSNAVFGFSVLPWLVCKFLEVPVTRVYRILLMPLALLTPLLGITMC